MTRTSFLLAVGCVVFATLARATVFENRMVGRIETPDPARDCVFFSLQGVTQADPGVPNSPWFAVPRSHPGFKEIYGALLSARLSSSLVSVYTTGQLEASCSSHAGVSTIIVEP